MNSLNKTIPAADNVASLFGHNGGPSLIIIDERLYRTKEAAEILGLSPLTLRNWRNSPRTLGHPTPEFVRIGRSVRYPGRGLRACIAALSA